MGWKMLKSMALLCIPRFLWDRVSIGRMASLNMALLRNPQRVVLAHLQRLEAQLQGQDFLFGATPNHADISTLHGLWFMRDLGESTVTADFPKVIAWMDRLLAFGDGQRSEIDGELALQIASQATPRKTLVRHRADALIGRRVGIRPADYAQDQTHGVLAGATPTPWILARKAAALGLVHVHFPKAGFELKALEP